VYVETLVLLGSNMLLNQFVRRLNKFYYYLLQHSEEYSTQLNLYEILKILDQAMSSKWHEAMLALNIDIF
jgi:hypothetical protein